MTGLQRHKPWTPTPKTIEADQRWRLKSRKRQAEKPRRQRNTGPNRKTRDALAERSGGVCEFADCWRPAEHDHHRSARGMGGSSNPDVNALSAQLHYCAIHHAYVEAHPAEAYANGWKVRRGTKKPGDVPVLTRHSPFPVLLDDLGDWRLDDTTNPKGVAA